MRRSQKRRLPNRHEITIGAPGMGKSTKSIDDALKEADRGDTAIVIEDPHPNSFAATFFEKAVAHGHASRILYDRLYDIDASLGYDFLVPSTAKNPLRRLAQNEQSIRRFIDLLTRRTNAAPIASTPYKEEWALNAGWLYVYQQPRKRLDTLYHAFEPGHKLLRRYIDDCTEQEYATPFKAIYDNEASKSHYLPAYRLIRGVCRSPAFALRCGATFDFDNHLNNKGILIVEGGSIDGVLSDDALRLMLGSISLKTITYIRNRPAPYPLVSHYLDEATNVDLITPYEIKALAELRKNNYGLKILVQQPDFPTTKITEQVFNLTATHNWFAVASSKLAKIAAADLGNADLEDSISQLDVGEYYVKRFGSYRHVHHKISEDPWIFPGLSKRKAEQALKMIQQRPEYQRTGSSATAPSKIASKRTPAPPKISSTSSPAARLRIAASKNSKPESDSESSAM